MIALTGGKTGGHISPLIAVANQLKGDVLYVGSKRSLEEKWAHRYRIAFLGLPLENNRWLAIVRAYFFLKKNLKVPPKAVFSSGGYVSLPLLLYAVIKRIPIYLLEENRIMGRSNAFFAIFAKKIFLSYELPKMRRTYQVVGQPLLNPTPSYLNYPQYRSDILVIGGSLGSEPLCRIAQMLSREFSVVLLAGRYAKKWGSKPNLNVLESVEDLPSLMLQARLVISRAGAATSAEIFSVSKPCILIPSRKTKKNHQYLNALYFKEKGCAMLINEDDGEEAIFQAVRALLHRETLRLNMQLAQRQMVSKDSAFIIAKELMKHDV